MEVLNVWMFLDNYKLQDRNYLIDKFLFHGV